MPKKDAVKPWAIVLAGGDGTRLQSLTCKIEGDSRPKQFSKIFGSDRHQIEPDWLCEIRRTNPPRLNALVSSSYKTMPSFRNLVTVP